MTDVGGADGVDGADDADPDGEGSARHDAAERPRESMRDVDHTPPHGDGASEVWRRGGGPEDVE